MSSSGSVMNRIRMFEASGGDSDADVDASDDRTRKIHPFNRPAGNMYQDARSTASPHKSSNEWQSFTSKSSHNTVAQGRERRTDSDDITGRGEPEARIGFTSFESHTADLEQRPAEGWDQSLTEPWNDKGSIDELDWPPTKAVQNPMVLNHDQNSGDGSQEPLVEPQSSPFHPSSWNQTSRSARLQTIRPRAPASLSGSSLSESNPELKRNLDAASVVMQEERESSIGSKSSSSRSSLSNDELGTVAKRAWKLSKIQSQTRASRLQNSPLHQMYKEKRSRKYVVEKPSQTIPVDEVEGIDVTPSESSNWEARRNPKSSDMASSNSELRLSARLFRAEKYASIVRHNREPRHSGDDATIDNSQLIEKSVGSVHPVFGYSANQTIAAREKHVGDDGTLSENSDSASGSRTASNDLATPSSKPEDAMTSALSANSRGNPSRSERARQLKAVLSNSKRKQSNTLTTAAAASDESSYESVEVQASGRGSEAHLDQYNDDAAPMDSAFESDFDHIRNPNSEQPRFDSTLNSVSDVENSVLDGEGIAQISSGDESALNWSITTGSVSATTPFAQLNTSSNEGSARISSKASSGGSQRLAPIPDDDPREHSLFSYTDSHTSSGREFQADKSSTDTSSSKSGMKPDALRWWQKKYGKKMSGTTNPVVRNTFTRVSPKGDQDNGFFKIEDAKDDDDDDKNEDDDDNKEDDDDDADGDEDEDEDDVFFGLEDDARFPTEKLPGAQELFSSEEDGDIEIPAPTYENRDTGGDENELKGEAGRAKVSHPVQAPLEPSRKQGVYGRSGMMVSEANAGRSVTSDMTSSIIMAGKAKKSPRYRPDVVETIREESVEEDQNGFGVESAEEGEDGEEMDETTVGSATNTNVESTIFSQPGSTIYSQPESTMYSQPPPPPPPPPLPGHVLLNIGCAIVDTFSNACQVPDPADVREPVAQCATKIRDTCKIKTDNFGKSYASACDTPKHDSASVQSDPAPSTLTEEERRIWSEWENRDQLSPMRETSSHHSGISDLLEHDDPLQVTEVQRNRREEARNKLLQYAEKAMTLLNSKREDKAPQEAQSPIEANQDFAVRTFLEDQRPAKLLTAAASPIETFTPLSSKERSVLEKFSSTLKNEGIEVLKLNRRNRWQMRFLSVSREVTWLNTQAEDANIGQCPKALLWLKRFKGSSYGVSNLKNKGRGGILFTKLRRVETTSRVMSSLETASKTSSCPIPKRLKAMYEENACVALEYLFEGGNRTVILCFKNTRDAKTFCAAMNIIRDVVEREQESTLSAMQIVESVVDRN